jgi:dTMP kinase
LAYQGVARGLGFDKVQTAHGLAMGNLLPDLTLWIDVDVELGLARANGRNAQRPAHQQSEARIDQQPAAFHEKVREGYARIAAREPHRFRIIGGDAQVAIVAERVWKEVEPLLPPIEIPTVAQ